VKDGIWIEAIMIRTEQLDKRSWDLNEISWDRGVNAMAMEIAID